MKKPLGMSVRALPGGDVLRWDCGSLLVLLALAVFVRQSPGENDPLPSHRNNLDSTFICTGAWTLMLPAHLKLLVADLRVILSM